MNKKLLLRIIIDIVLFGFVMAGAGWIIFPVGLVATWYYKKFFEFPLSAFTFDTLFWAPRERLFESHYAYTFIAILIFIIIVFLKSKIRKDLWPKSF